MQKKKNYRLKKCKIYVTLEPCLMCLGAMINARIQSLIYGASNNEIKLFSRESKKILKKIKNRKIGFTIIHNILQKPCSNILISFFKKKR